MRQADDCAPLVQASEAGQIKMAALARGHYPGRRLQENALPGVKTVGYWDAATEQKWGLPWHCNEGIEISYLESGSLDFALDESEFTLEPGDLIITRPWQMHRLGGPFLKPNKLHWLIFDVGVRRPHQTWKWPRWLMLNSEEAGELERTIRLNTRAVWHASQEMRHCFHLIAQAAEMDAASSHISRLGIRINDLLLLLLEMFRSEPLQPEHCSRGSRQKVRLFLTALASDPDSLAAEWTVESMADQCGLKMTQFVRYTKELTNMAPLHYLNHSRLEHAARLLREQSSVSVTNLALACGFSSSQYFATLFKRRFGCTPREFRAT
ncbi:MAG: AraC family transcriptional regulator [Bryobacteraceae bacterium]